MQEPANSNKYLVSTKPVLQDNWHPGFSHHFLSSWEVTLAKCLYSDSLCKHGWLPNTLLTGTFLQLFYTSALLLLLLSTPRVERGGRVRVQVRFRRRSGRGGANMEYFHFWWNLRSHNWQLQWYERVAVWRGDVLCSSATSYPGLNLRLCVLLLSTTTRIIRCCRGIVLNLLGQQLKRKINPSHMPRFCLVDLWSSSNSITRKRGHGSVSLYRKPGSTCLWRFWEKVYVNENGVKRHEINLKFSTELNTVSS